ncbi:MAG: ABC transporter permease protein [Candidatus Tokpelaia hoelldobleri]|uniref:ABC transporter permease protein n=1 Tax=Candidatus Tokpelaia hoelldobleri TaxID=1902579 RepID=A0A1U9JT45_9HYPH|nr:MAG: ABC transporter permease protein [Candidatus Tokpelaia hoelldoblerii]
MQDSTELAILQDKLLADTLATLWMTFSSSLMTLVVGLPLGVLLYTTAKNGLFQNSWLNWPFSIFLNSLRALPFIVMAAVLTPVSKAVIGKITGDNVVIFILSVSAIPFYARMVELSLRSVDKNLIDAIRAMGATRLQIIREVILPEALSSLVTGFTVTVIAILSASSLAGYLGGESLGTLAVRYGIQNYMALIVWIVVLILILMNVIIQWFGDRLADKFNHL